MPVPPLVFCLFWFWYAESSAEQGVVTFELLASSWGEGAWLRVSLRPWQEFWVSCLPDLKVIPVLKCPRYINSGVPSSTDTATFCQFKQATLPREFCKNLDLIRQKIQERLKLWEPASSLPGCDSKLPLPSAGEPQEEAREEGPVCWTHHAKGLKKNRT